MKIRSILEKIIYFIGLVLFLNGLARPVGPLEYNSFIPNNTVALVYIFIGIAIMFSSLIFKHPKN